MLHNNKADLTRVLNNVEEAINSKLLMMGQGSGKCEQHAAGYVALVQTRELLVTELEKLTVAEAKATAKSTK